MSELKEKRLVVLTSTLPRWEGDATTTFVLDHCKMLAPYFKDVVIVAPHYEGSKKREKLASNLYVRRVRYSWPAKTQYVFYDGGAADRISASPIYLLKVGIYILGILYTLLRLRPGKNMVINANWIIPQGIPAVIVRKLFRRVRLVSTARGADVFTLNGKLPKYLKRMVLKNSDAVFVNSGALRQSCIKIYEREYIQQPTGYDDSRLTKKPESFYKKSKDAPLVLLSAGRLTDGKGFMDILKALKLLDGKKIELKIAGEGPERPALEKYISKNGLEDKATLLGWVESVDMREFYQKADVYVGAPHQAKNGWKEAFGNVYAEAMACGTPIIVTTAAGASEIVEEGKTGFVIKPSAPDELSKRLNQFYENRSIIGDMGRAAALAVKPYSKSAARDKYLEVFKDLCNES